MKRTSPPTIVLSRVTTIRRVHSSPRRSAAHANFSGTQFSQRRRGLVQRKTSCPAAVISSRASRPPGIGASDRKKPGAYQMSRTSSPCSFGYWSRREKVVRCSSGT